MKERNWVQVINADMVEGPVERISHAEIVNAIKMVKTGKAAGHGSGQVGEEVMRGVCERVLDGKGMPVDRKTSMVVPIYKGKGIKVFEHGVIAVERVLEKKITINSGVE